MPSSSGGKLANCLLWECVWWYSVLSVPTIRKLRKQSLKQWVTGCMYSVLCDLFHNIFQTRSFVCNDSHCFLWDVITHLCPSFYGSLVKPTLKLGHGSVIASHIFMGSNFLLTFKINHGLFHLYHSMRSPVGALLTISYGHLTTYIRS